MIKVLLIEKVGEYSLITQAKLRGFDTRKSGAVVDQSNLYQDLTLTASVTPLSRNLFIEDGCLYFGGYLIYNKGEWAKIFYV